MKGEGEENMQNDDSAFPQCGQTLKRAVYQGFTLVEMVVVILIIGVLLGIAIPSYQYYNKAAWNASVSAEATEIMTSYLSSCANTVNASPTLNTPDLVAAYMSAPETTALGGSWVVTVTTTSPLVATATNGLIISFTPPTNGCQSAPNVGSSMVVTPAVSTNPVFTNTLPVIAITAQGSITYTQGN